MNQETLEQLQYPIGKFNCEAILTTEILNEAIRKIKNFPKQLDDTIVNLPKSKLINRYRPEGWTIAQVIHHLADSHMHSYLRFKHAQLEQTPSIKDYEEAKWAMLPDASKTEIIYSLNLLKALHCRWEIFLKNLTPEDFKKSYYHPGRNKYYSLDTTLLIYAWHGEHHLAHIKNAIKNGY